MIILMIIQIAMQDNKKKNPSENQGTGETGERSKADN